MGPFLALRGSRSSAEETMNHPWLGMDTIHPESKIDTSKLKRYVIKKRWIKAVNTIIALKRMGAKIDTDLIHNDLLTTL
ncbi:unnamed protein product [Phyllotreta striolata]|uniref:Uncharacterized protein n=1 Tax=Phyllotreta striolata TaxID=444603 RepID=A0A9N9XUX5_PHYSR|nr:unnamed protein product [Phyllotreta striolata]